MGFPRVSADVQQKPQGMAKLGTVSSAGQARAPVTGQPPATGQPPVTGRSIGRHVGIRVTAPVVSLVVLWILVTGALLSADRGKIRWPRSISPSQQILIEVAVVAGLGLVIVLVTVLLLRSFAKRLSRELSGLTAASPTAPTAPTALASDIIEIASAAKAVAGMREAALCAASAEAGLRDGLRRILASLAKRNQALLHRQLRIIDELERQAVTPAALGDLFALDHLTTRMRRNAESLTILSGAAPARSWSGPVPVIDVLRAAAAEVEDYTRVTIITDSEETIAAAAVTDLIHLMAELIENATLFSPSTTRVEVRADWVANGFVIEVEDRGLGIPAGQLAEINERLADPPDLDHADPDRLGLFVAGLLAGKHGVQVSLCPSPYRGIKAVVVLPGDIVTPAGQAAEPARPTMRAVPGPADGAVRLNLRAPGVLSLADAAEAAADAADDIGAGIPAGVAAGIKAAPEDPTTEPAITTRNGLPRRVRLASAPQRPPNGEAGDDVRRKAPSGPAPEEARTLAASLQSSWRRSRQPGTEPQTATRDDSASRDGLAGEEA